jgi:S-(hydroxymethyl)glutathione dehydrogenase/alcohol dehydrogenase
LENEIFNIVGKNGADVVIETTGITKVIEQAYQLTASNGKTILVGVPREKISIHSLPLFFDKELTGSHGGGSDPASDIPRYIRLINNNKMSLKELITHEFNLADINKAIELFRSGKAGRIIIKNN